MQFSVILSSHSQELILKSCQKSVFKLWIILERSAVHQKDSNHRRHILQFQLFFEIVQCV
jgi:hypothetical protein